ncbi:MAG: TonB-dependent receptor [Methylomarinum sp.]|nr:TonB-dependent receptor [Methylomarinum sp.]
MTNKGLNLKLIGLLICSYSCVLLADDDMEDFFSMSPAELANIPVTIATGTAKPAYLSASVTTVITAQQIDTMGATELDQVLETVPGLHVSIQAVTNDTVYSMRGIQNGVNAQVLVLLNGTRFSVPYKGSSMTGMRLPVEAIQQIEVIRGPGSALYGADAFAGVINIITKKAKDIDGTVIGVRGGSWDTQSVWGQHSNQLLGWDIATSLQYAHNNNDGDRIINSDLQSQFDRNFSTDASLAPNEMQTKLERWNAHLNLQRKHWDIDFWAFNEVDAGLLAGAGGALDDEGKLNGQNYLTDLKFSSEDLVDDWEFLAHASYLYTNIDAEIHNFPDGTLLPIDGNGEINPTVPFVLNPTFFPEGVLSEIGIENQVASFEMSSIYKGFDDHLLRLTSGFRYEQVRTKESRNFGKGITVGTLTNVTGTNFVFLPDSQRSIWSVALQDEWQISQDWQLTAGVRYDEYSDFGSTFNPRVALVWGINEQLSAKLMYGQAFRAPSFLEQKQQNSQLFVGNPSLKPENIETVELAFDYRPIENLRLASNFYFYEIEDLIATSLGGTTVPTVNNSEGQTGVGTEFEWDWQFHEQWNLKGNYAWQYARNEETKGRVIGVPEHQIYVAAAWQFLPKWQLQTQFNWVGHRLNFEGSTNSELKDYETIDITVNSKRFFGYVDFTASARNVLDSHGKEPAINSYPDNFPIASRSFYLETTVHF